MRNLFILIFFTACINAQEVNIIEEKKLQKIAFEKELQKKEARKESLKREIEKLRQLMLEEEKQKLK